jgi:hypothetical protein
MAVAFGLSPETIRRVLQDLVLIAMGRTKRVVRNRRATLPLAVAACRLGCGASTTWSAPSQAHVGVQFLSRPENKR